MAGYDPNPADETAAQQAAIRAKAIALLKTAGPRPSTPPEVLDKMLELLDPADLAATLAAVKKRWPVYFGTPRSADVIASRARR